MSQPVVDFVFSPTSRYAYLAASQIDLLALQFGCRFNWLPVDTQALILKARGVSPFGGHPPAMQYDFAWRNKDGLAWAELYGIPFVEPHGRLTYDARLLAVAATAAMILGAAEAFARNVMREAFTTERKTMDGALYVKLAGQSGLDQAAFEAALDDPATGERLDRTIAEAAGRGAFGVPTFLIDDRVIWGNDRLPLLRRHLATRPAAP